MSEPRPTSLVTGANTGIGLVTATELARQGHRVILACRSEEKTRPAMEAITAATGNEAVEFLPLDLADLRSAGRGAATLLERGDPLHVLVANAGVAGQRGQTVQGFELAFGINHLGHFRFVTDLVPLLVSSAPSRIVIVSSDSHYSAKGIDFDVLRRSTSNITGLPEYAVSKLANVLFAQELARRLPEEVFVGALHPGVIASDVWRRVPVARAPAHEAVHEVHRRGRADLPAAGHLRRGARAPQAPSGPRACSRSRTRWPPPSWPPSSGLAVRSGWPPSASGGPPP